MPTADVSAAWITLDIPKAPIAARSVSETSLCTLPKSQAQGSICRPPRHHANNVWSTALGCNRLVCCRRLSRPVISRPAIGEPPLSSVRLALAGVAAFLRRGVHKKADVAMDDHHQQSFCYLSHAGGTHAVQEACLQGRLLQALSSLAARILIVSKVRSSAVAEVSSHTISFFKIVPNACCSWLYTAIGEIRGIPCWFDNNPDQLLEITRLLLLQALWPVSAGRPSSRSGTVVPGICLCIRTDVGPVELWCSPPIFPP